MRKKIFALVFLFLLTLSSHSLADELSGTTWTMFIPNFGGDTLVVSFSEIQQHGSAIEGVFKTAATDPMHFTNGSIKKTSDGYEFKIVVPSEPPSMVFKGKILPAPEAGYSPKDFYEKSTVKILNSNGIKILYKISVGSMYSKVGFPPITQTTFKNATGVVFLPKQ